MVTAEEVVEQAECPLKVGELAWRRVESRGERGSLVLGDVHFSETERGDYTAKIRRYKNHWCIYGQRGKVLTGLVAFLPKRYVPLSEDIVAFVVTGISKNGKSVFVRPAVDIDMDDMRGEFGLGDSGI